MFSQQSALFLFISWVMASHGNSTNGLVRRVVEGSQVTIMCRIPTDHVSRVMEPSSSMPASVPVIWVRFDMKDSSNHMVISHGDTLLIRNPRLRVNFDVDTGKSVLTIDGIQSQDGGSYQCQVPNESENVSSPPIEIIVESARAESQSASTNAINVLFLVAVNLIHYACTALLVH